MKKIILLVTMLTVIAATSLMAQDSDTADLVVTATVVNSLSVTATTNVSFGNVEAGSTAHVNAGTGDATSTDNAGTPQAGLITIAGNSNGTVFVSWGTGTLTDPAGGSATTFTPTVVFDDDPLANEGSVTLDGSGDATLGVGGTLAAITSGVAGSYSTENDNGLPVTFTVQYNSF